MLLLFSIVIGIPMVCAIIIRICIPPRRSDGNRDASEDVRWWTIR